MIWMFKRAVASECRFAAFPLEEFTIILKPLRNGQFEVLSMALFYGSQGVMKQSKIKKQESNWRMRSNYRSPFYTTNWNDILKVS